MLGSLAEGPFDLWEAEASTNWKVAAIPFVLKK
jgi:hypothetical protein